MFDYQKVIWEIFLPANQSNLFYQFSVFTQRLSDDRFAQKAKLQTPGPLQKKDTALRQAERTEQRYLEVTWEDGPF